MNRRQMAWTIVLGVAMGLPAAVAEHPAEAYAGFSGQVRGEVTELTDGGIRFRVGEVQRVWDGNRMERPRSLAGQLILVGPGGGEDNVARTRLHKVFLRQVRPGTPLTLEVHNPDGRGFRILELTEDQRALVRDRVEPAPAEAELRERRMAAREARAAARDADAPPPDVLPGPVARERMERMEQGFRERMERQEQAFHERLERAVHEREMLIGVLREEIRHLHRENAELQQHLERMERERAERPR